MTLANDGAARGLTTPNERHLVRFYEDDEELVRAAAAFIGDGLGAGERTLVIATDAHLRAFGKQLTLLGVNVERAVASGQLLLTDAHQMLERLMRDGMPDRGAFESELGTRVAELGTGARLRAYGEMVDILWKRGERSAAIYLEELWNELQSRHSFTLLCAYAMARFFKEPAALERVCAAHGGRLGAGNGAELPHTLPADYARHLAREIAQRKEVEAALRESLRELREKESQLVRSQEQLEDFVENASIGLRRVGPDGTILWANRAELEMFGYSAEEYVGRPLADFQLDQELAAEIFSRLQRGERVDDYEAYVRAKDGSVKRVMISSSAYFRDGEFVHTRCFTRDMTRHREAEEALRQSERQLQIVTDSLPTLVSFVDSERRYRFVSAAYERWFGHRKAEIIGRRVEDVIGGAAYAAVRAHMDRALAGEIVRYEAELPYAYGGSRHVEAAYIPQVENGRVRGFVALIADISERKNFELFRAEAAARAERLMKITAAIADAVSEAEVYEALVNHVADALGASNAALWLLDGDGAEAQLARSVGHSPAALDRLRRLPAGAIEGVLGAAGPGRVACLPLVSQGRKLGVLGLALGDAPETADEHHFLLLVARYAGQALERLRLLDAERRSRLEADRTAARTGELYRFASAVVSADTLERVFEAALDAIEGTLGTDRAAILLLDGDGVMRFAASRRLSPEYRAAVEGHCPWPRDATAPQPVLVVDVCTDTSLASYLPLFEREGIGALAFVPLVTRGQLIGKFMVYHAAPHAFTQDEIELAGALANHLASVTSRFRAFARLEDSLHENELFAGVLAHDLRNPLGAMMTAAQLLLMRQEEGSRGAKPLSRILASGQRMTRMIDQLLDFTRARVGGGIELEPCRCNLWELCDQAIDELELANPQWKVTCEAAGDLHGNWDSDRLLQLVSNLVGNAGQHGHPDAGVRVRLDGREPDWVTLAVENQGVIPESLREHLFDPFRVARHRRDHSRGLGLGLFIVHEIVRAHAGTLELSSSVELGITTFTIRLPRRTTERTGA